MRDSFEKPPLLLRWLPSTPAGHVALVMAVMVVAMAVAGYLFRHFSQQVEARTRASLETIAFSQREGLSVFMQERFLNARLFSQRQLLRDFSSRSGAGSVPPAMAAEMQDWAQRMQAVYRYHDVRVLAPDLRVLQSLRSNAILPEIRASLREALTAGKPVFIDLHLDPGAVPVFGVASPVFAGDDAGSRPVGILLLEVDARTDIYPLLERWPAALPTGEALLFRREGQRVRYLAPLRFAPEQAPLSVVRGPGGAPGFVPVRAGERERLVSFEGVDYRGHEVLAATVAVPGTPWLLQTKIDHDEYLAPVHRLQVTLLLALALILVLLVIAAVLAMRGQRAELAAARAAHDARFGASRRASLDGLLEVSDEGLITDLNPTMAEMLGATREELLMQPLLAIEGTRNALELEAALAALRSRGAERFRSRFRHRGGHLVDVAISASYLPGEDSGTFFLAVHDIGPELAAQARGHRLNQFYAFLSLANAAIFNLRDPVQILDAICDNAVTHGGLAAARGGFLDAAAGEFRTVAGRGWDLADVGVGYRLPGLDGAPELLRQAIAGNALVVANDYLNDPRTAARHEAARRAGIRSVALVPVQVKGRLVCVLGFYAGEKDWFDEEFRRLLEEVAFNVSLALETATAERERDQALAGLARNESRLRQIVDASPLPVMLMSAATQEIGMVNRAFTATFGYRREDVPTAQQWMAAAYPDPVVRAALVEHWQAAVGRARDDGTVEPSPELQLTCRDGRVRTVRAFMSATGDDIVVQWEDLSDIRAAEQSLRESEQGFRGLIEETFTGVYVQQDDRIVYANPRMTDLTGWSQEELLGHDPLKFFQHDATAAEALRRLHGQVLEGSPSVAVELPFMTRSGRPIALAFHVARSTWNKRQAIIAMVHDITERKAAEARIAEYVEQLERTMQGTLQAVSVMVEMRDPYTAGHQRRVGIIAADIGRELGWEAERCRWLAEVGMVHDIGKVGVPAEILTKPGRLTALERKLVQEHAHKGYEILCKVEFPLPLAEIVHQHHERMDGSGYPRGLKGPAILPEARVLAVADVLESMAADRPYRPALGMAAALAELEEHAGSWFDAEVVAALARMVREKGYRLPE